MEDFTYQMSDYEAAVSRLFATLCALGKYEDADEMLQELWDVE